VICSGVYTRLCGGFFRISFESSCVVWLVGVGCYWCCFLGLGGWGRGLVGYGLFLGGLCGLVVSGGVCVRGRSFVGCWGVVALMVCFGLVCVGGVGCVAFFWGTWWFLGGIGPGGG
jgi:hypothetical protein